MRHYGMFDLDMPYSWHSTMVWRGTTENGYFICVPKPIAWFFHRLIDLKIFYYEQVLWLKYRSPIQWGHK